jgi:cytochrome c oxidase subunit 2
LAQYTAPQPKGGLASLGRGFWLATAAMTVINIAITWWIIALDIPHYLPELGAPADRVDFLFKFMSVVANAIFVYVVGYIAYFSIVHRRRATDAPDAIGIQIDDNPRLEFWWTVIPTILVAIVGFYSVQIWRDLQNSAGDVLTVEAIGHQYKYEFRYPKLKQSVYQDMHVPAGTPITVHVTSADVIHSFWVPEARIKADMVPGLVQTLRFTPDQAGVYRIICTEFCGTNHSHMNAVLHVDTQEQFQQWLSMTAKQQGQGEGPVAYNSGAASDGKVTFGQKCSSCHSVGEFSQKIVGPGLGHLVGDPVHKNLVTGKPPTAENIGYILINGYQGPDMSDPTKSNPPIGVMPNRQANALNNKDIANLTAYLLSPSK